MQITRRFVFPCFDTAVRNADRNEPISENAYHREKMQFPRLSTFAKYTRSMLFFIHFFRVKKIYHKLRHYIFFIESNTELITIKL